MLDMGVVPSDERTMKTTPRERKNKPIVKITYLNTSDFIEKPFFLPLQRYEFFFRGEGFLGARGEVRGEIGRASCRERVSINV